MCWHNIQRAFLALLVVGTLHCGATAAFATASVSTLANAALSADTAGGSYTTLTGPALAEEVTGDIGIGTIILNAPAGFVFDPTANVAVQVSKLGGAGAPLKLASSSATVTSTTITIRVSAIDGKEGTTSRLTWSGIRGRPTAGTPLATGDLTAGGSAVLAGISATTRFGTLTETVGAANQLVIVTQPPDTALAGEAFAPAPVVRVEDQFGNLRTNGTLVVSATANVGSGFRLGFSSAMGGVVTFTNLAYPWGRTITLTFSSGALLPATSTPIDVTGPEQPAPAMPAQTDRTLYELSTLVVTNRATDPYVPVDTSGGAPDPITLIHFDYPSRSALLADGWSFLATNPDGTARDTEITDPAMGAMVSYDQTAHPGVLQVPCDEGDLWGSLNNSRNSLFRSVPTNWVSLQLALGFAPTLDYEQVHLALYQDDDNFIQAGIAHNDGLGGEIVTLVWETAGTPDHFVTSVDSLTNLYLRLDRVAGSPTVTGRYSVDGSHWTVLGSTDQALVNPRLAIWGGGSAVPWTNGLAVCSLQQLEVQVDNTATPPLVYQLVDAPPGATIDGNGVITWTPPLGAGSSTNLFTTVVTDNQVPQASATNRFSVVVVPLPDRPLLPVQTNLVLNQVAALTITNTAIDRPPAAQIVTNTLLFTYTDRNALLADGWSFLATQPDGSPRDTEITDAALGAVVSYDQSAHPGVLRLPCDLGDLWASLNNTRNSLFRDLPANWLSVRLALSFSPTANNQQAHLALYQNDDNYVQAGLAFNGEQKVALDQETSGFPATLLATAAAGSNAQLRLDRDLATGAIAALYSSDTTTWNPLGQAAQALANPKLGIWVGGAQVPYTDGAPNCDLQRLELVVSNPPAPLVLTYQLLNPPAGATIDAHGLITWTPAQEGIYTLTTVVTDNANPPLSATNSFTVTINPPPQLALRYSAAENLVQFTFSGVPQTTYQLFWAPSLDGPWTLLAPVETDASGQALYRGPAPAATAFFRLAAP
jgi:regulation of enolase protein 1 (concanavalin A-like superfamily)